MSKISWTAFWAWIGIEAILTGIVGIEEAGITHLFGRIPITWMAVGDPKLFIAIEMAFLVLGMWWPIHWYRRKYGDLSKRKDTP